VPSARTRAGCAGTPPRPGWFFLDKIFGGGKVKHVKRKKQGAYQEWHFMVRYEPYRGYFVEGAPGRKRFFASKMEAENYCTQRFKQCPVDCTPQTNFQDLPKCSVWTGAPWDKTFKHLR
jgi:hypothetical protein